MGIKVLFPKFCLRKIWPIFKNGKPIDMVFNTLGVPSRMNPGQIFEYSLKLGEIRKKDIIE